MSFHLYTDLPPELRRQIRLDAIENHCRLYDNNEEFLFAVGHFRKPREFPLAPYACVDREWREDVERRLFKELCLHECQMCMHLRRDELDTFEALLVGARQSYLSTLDIDFKVCVYEYEVIWGSREAAVVLAEDGTPPASPWLCNDAILGVLHRLLHGLKRWDLDKVFSRPLPVQLWFSCPPRKLFPTGASMDWPLGTIELPSELPSVPFVHITFHSDDTWALVKPLPLLRVFKAIPKLRSVTVNHITPSSDRWTHRESEEFVMNLEDAVPGLKELCVHGETLPKDLKGALRKITLGLEAVELGDSVDPGFFFEPFDFAGPNIQPPPLLEWNSLRTLEISEFLFEHQSRDEVERLVAATGRAVAFMPSLEFLWITTGLHYDIEFYLKVAVSIKARPLDTEKTCLLSFVSHVPFPAAVSIWRDSVMQTQRAPLDVRVERSGTEEGWKSWEDVIEEQAAANLEQQEVESDEP